MIAYFQWYRVCYVVKPAEYRIMIIDQFFNELYLCFFVLLYCFLESFHMLLNSLHQRIVYYVSANQMINIQQQIVNPHKDSQKVIIFQYPDYICYKFCQAIQQLNSYNLRSSMKISKRRNEVLSQIGTENNTASTSNYVSVNQISSLQSKIQNLEISLDVSLKNQKLLQDSLQYMLQLQKTLRKELEEKESFYESRIKQLEKQYNVKMDQYDNIHQNLEGIRQLLQESDLALRATKQKLSEQQIYLSRKQTTIREQKKVIESLQSERLYSNLNGHRNIIKEQNDNLIYELKQSYEKKIHELQFSLKRSDNAHCSEKVRSDKLQKQLNQFKRWLCGLVGIEKIVAGCETMIMNQVTKRLTL